MRVDAFCPEIVKTLVAAGQRLGQDELEDLPDDVDDEDHLDAVDDVRDHLVEPVDRGVAGGGGVEYGILPVYAVGEGP